MLKITMALQAVILAATVLLNLLVEPPRPRPTYWVRLVAFAGKVEVKKAGSSTWQPAKFGQELRPDDEIRTGPFSEATLRASGSTTLVVSAESSFHIGELLANRSSFELATGQVRAAIPDANNREYEFRALDRQAVARSTAGEFDLISNGKDSLLVDTHRGTVNVEARGRKVKVGRGKRSVVRRGAPPSPPMPIPASLALQVKWPPSKIRKKSTRLQGITQPGALVSVNGVTTRADATGRFAVVVPLRMGTNRLVVTTTDPAGRKTRQQVKIVEVDTRPPKIKVEYEDSWQ